MLSTEVDPEPNLGDLVYEAEIRDCTLDEVCVVLIADRALVLPIAAHVARGSGLHVVPVDERILLAVGVQPVRLEAHVVEPRFHEPPDRPVIESVIPAFPDAAPAPPSGLSAPVAPGISSVAGLGEADPAFHSVDDEKGLAGTLPSVTVATGEVQNLGERRSNMNVVAASFDQIEPAPRTDTAEVLPGSSPPNIVAPTPTVGSSAIAPQAVDWSMLDELVEPARPLEVESALREDDGGVSPVAWPEIDRRSPEQLAIAPAAYNPNAGRPNGFGPGQRANDPGDAPRIQASLAPTAPPTVPVEEPPAAVGSGPTVMPLGNTAPSSGLQPVFAAVVASRLTVHVPGGVTNDLDFVLAPGEVMELRADDASVASAVLHVLAGFTAPASGTIDVDGENRGTLAVGERLRRRALSAAAMVDSVILIPERSVLTNLEIPLLAAGIGPDTARRMAEARIESMGLSVLANYRVDALSTDQYFLAAAARSLVMPTPLLVVDNPTGALGDGGVAYFLGLLNQARQGGAVVVYQSSDPRFRFPDARLLSVSTGQPG